MEVVILQVFVSLGLVVGSLVLFGFTCRQRTFDHADRLSLLPLDGEDLAPRRTNCAGGEGPAPSAHESRRTRRGGERGTATASGAR